MYYILNKNVPYMKTVAAAAAAATETTTFIFFFHFKLFIHKIPSAKSNNTKRKVY